MTFIHINNYLGNIIEDYTYNGKKKMKNLGINLIRNVPKL